MYFPGVIGEPSTEMPGGASSMAASAAVPGRPPSTEGSGLGFRVGGLGVKCVM